MSDTSARVTELLGSPRYEVLPFGDIEESVLEHKLRTLKSFG